MLKLSGDPGLFSFAGLLQKSWKVKGDEARINVIGINIKKSRNDYGRVSLTQSVRPAASRSLVGAPTDEIIKLDTKMGD